MSPLKFLLSLSIFLQFTGICLAQDTENQDYTVLKDIMYAPGDTLKTDIYLPIGDKKQQHPVLIFGNGFGSDYRKWDHYTAWAKLAAAEGFVCMLYASRQNQAEVNLDKLLHFITAAGAGYGADAARISVFAGSSNVTAILPLANKDQRIKAALIYYGTATLDTFRLDLPVLLVRAGLDNIPLNKKLDTLAFRALQAYAPYTVVSYAAATHPFEDVNDPDAKRFMITSLDFLRTNTDLAFSDLFSKKAYEITAMREMYHANWEGALAAFQQALINNPGNNETERQIGNVYMEMNRYEAAVKSYNDALAHGNWRKGEIAQKKCLAFAMLRNTEASIEEMKVLQRIGWFKESDYSSHPAFTEIVSTLLYKEFVKGIK